MGGLLTPLLQSAGTIGTTAILLLASILLYATARILYNLFLHPIRQVPGPWWWAATSLPFDYHTFNGTAMHRILELHQRHGTEVRICPDEVSLADGGVWKDIYNARPEFPRDPKRTKAQPDPVKNIFLADKDDHSRYRRLLAYAFSAKGIREQEPRFQHYIDLLIERLHEAATAKESADMVDWYTRTVFDVLGDLTWGESFNGLKDRRTHEWVEVSMKATESFFKISTLLKYHLAPLIPVLCKPELLQSHKLNVLYSAELTERRAQAGSEPQGDFWDKVLAESGDRNKGKGMSLDEMKTNASFLILAGAETTATTLSGATYLLCRHPDALLKLTQEIRSTFTSREDIDLTAVGHLQYLHQVIFETLRLYPAVVDGLPRVTPRGGGQVLGRWYPDHTTLHTNHLAMNRLPSNFTRPDDFVPERWASNPPAENLNDKRDAFQPFSQGTRNCIGQNLAHAEMRLILSKVLFEFDLELDHNKMAQQGDWYGRQKNFGIWFKDPVWLRLKARER